MAIKRLGVSNPSANVNTALYTSNATYLTSVIATNTGNAAATVTVWVVPNGVTSPTGYGYILHSVVVPVGNAIESHRFAISNLDAVYVTSTTGTVSFSLNGMYDSTASIDAHLIQTTNVHGIADTANLATLTTTNALNDRLVAIELGLGIFD